MFDALSRSRPSPWPVAKSRASAPGQDCKRTAPPQPFETWHQPAPAWGTVGSGSLGGSQPFTSKFLRKKRGFMPPMNNSPNPNPTPSVTEEMISKAKAAFEQGEGLSLEYRLGNVLLAMKSSTPQQTGWFQDEEMRRHSDELRMDTGLTDVERAMFSELVKRGIDQDTADQASQAIAALLVSNRSGVEEEMRAAIVVAVGALRDGGFHDVAEEVEFAIRDRDFDTPSAKAERLLHRTSKLEGMG